MAVTHGHGNPHWNRDETILALDVYFANRGRNLSARDPAVIELSGVLRRLPYHQGAARQPTFRNPDGAAFKVQNLRSQETGKGLQNVSNMDRAIWREFGDRPAEVSRLANLIRAGIAAPLPEVGDPADEDVEFYEGRLLTRSHLTRERSRKLRTELLRKRRQQSAVRCEICAGDYAELPAEIREAAFEAHHVIPVSAAGARRTKLSEVALVCATCHRLLHRLIALQRRWITVSEARSLLRSAGGA